MKYNISWLTELYNQQPESLKYLFFWGHTPDPSGQISKTCFSQWWPCPFTVNEISYPTAEHWMMAEKARLFGDTEILEKIIHCQTPAQAKAFGRKVRNFDAAQWDIKKSEIVVEGNLYKFGQNQELKDFLLMTGERVLVEASPSDKIWGIGMNANHPDIEKPTHWKGQNLLGFALMEVRDILKK